MGDLFERVHANLQHKVHIMQTPAAHYLVPPKSGFLMADMIKWYDLLAASSEYSRSGTAHIRKHGSYPIPMATSPCTSLQHGFTRYAMG